MLELSAPVIAIVGPTASGKTDAALFRNYVVDMLYPSDNFSRVNI